MGDVPLLGSRSLVIRRSSDTVSAAGAESTGTSLQVAVDGRGDETLTGGSVTRS